MVGRLGKLIDSKLDNFRDEFRAGNNDNQNVKSIAEKYLEPRAFKKNGKEKQFTINAQVLECLDQAVSAVDKNKLDKAKETLKTDLNLWQHLGLEGDDVPEELLPYLHRIPDVVLLSRAPHTIIGYVGQLKKWATFAKSYKFQVFPARPMDLSLFC